METQAQTNNELPGKSHNFAGVEYYDVKRAAAFMGVHPETLKRETARGRISSFKLGKNIWYKPCWIHDYINEKTRIGIYKQS